VSAGEVLLRVNDLRVTIGQAHILGGVSFEVREGGIMGVLGRNGVGKTTTLRAILGLVPRTGSVTLAGEELTTLPVHEIVRRGVGYVPEDRDVFAGLSVEQNLRLAERPGCEHRYELVYELFPELRERARQAAGTLSGGQQQMVAIARALLNASNRILLVDEPTKGLSPLLVKRVADALKRAAEVVTIVLVEQNLAVARHLVRDVVVLDQGLVVYGGDVAALVDDPALARKYLGLAAVAGGR
jgi:branched-chain amino acid transport system ATP-binding protein